MHYLSRMTLVLALIVLSGARGLATNHFNTTNHLVIQLQNAGISWKAYQESISGTTCPTASSGLYAAYHNPFVYFDDIYLDAANCAGHIRPYPELARDLTNHTVA